MILKYNLERLSDPEDIDLTVGYRYHKAFKAPRSRYEPPTIPDEPEDVEIESIKRAGKDFNVTKEEEAKILLACWDDVRDSRTRI